MAERRLHGLQRVLGVNALFSTAYGNVGSSIYYALGLVASFALGLTPVVFVITGFIFYLTAATYAEATAMYPEAGGSSSFARHAFNEFASFFAAWAQMLNYTITIAISAFFVPHYLGGVAQVDALRHAPGDIFFTIGLIIVLSVVNVRGVKESAGVNIGLAVVDFLTQLLLVAVGIFLVFTPQVLIDNVHFGIAPTWKDFFVAIPVGMIAYTGIETISNMAEEAKDEEKTIPAAINRVVIAVFAIYSLLPMVALSALPVHQDASGKYVTQLGLPEDQGGFAGDPVLGRGQALRPRVPAGAGGGLRRHPRGDDPADRGQRRDHRRVAAGVLDGHPPPDAGPPAPAAPALRDAVHRDHDLRRDRVHRRDPGQGGVPGQHVRLRRDVVVHDRAHRGRQAAPVAARRAAAVDRAGQPRGSAAAARCRCSPSSAGSSRCWRSSSSPRCTSTSRWPASAGCCWAW